MKLILKTNTKTTYYVPIPNYADQSKVEELLEEVPSYLPEGVEVIGHQIHSDQLTNDERKQLDIYGKVLYPMVALEIANVG